MNSRLRICIGYKWFPFLKNALKEGSHEYILDRLIIQFEPDTQEYVRISHKVYDDLAASVWRQSFVSSEIKSKSNVVTRLRSTRHYGPFVLYVISQLEQPTCLIQEALSHQAINVTYWLLLLTSIIHPESKLAKQMGKHELPPSELIPDKSTVLEYTRVSIPRAGVFLRTN